MKITDTKEEKLAWLNRKGRFGWENGIRITDLGDDFALGELKIQDKVLNLTDKVHGGAMMTLADMVAGACIHSSQGLCVTTSQNMDFLRVATGDTIYGKGIVRKFGKVLSIIDVSLWDETKKEVAKGSFTFYVMPEQS